jgi:hypothetical protein
MHLKFGLTSIGGILIGATDIWMSIKWVLDWKGRYDAGASIMSGPFSSIPDIPEWLYLPLLSTCLVLICLKWWDSRSPQKEKIEIVISPLMLAVLLTACALGAWGWFLFDRAKGPIIWTFGDGPHPIFAMRGGGSERPLISALQLAGTNRSDNPISNIDGYLRSNITNKKLDLFFHIDGKYIKTIDTNGIPPHADFVIFSPFTEDKTKLETISMPTDKFLAEFGDMTLSLTFDGNVKPYIRNFSYTELSSVIAGFEKSIRESGKQKPIITIK